MHTELLASLVLGLHLVLAVAIVAGLILIPVGGYFGWCWILNRRLRLLHAGLMCFVALEALLGLTCPLTVMEYALRGGEAPEYFIASLLHDVLYWNLPAEIFLVAYLASATWVIILWWKVPPKEGS
ncbi:MAG: DUF2784 family protein [Burkholderiaceae bacterium]|jgi:hypothetical protein